MTNLIDLMIHTLLIGIGATVIMDIWLMLLKRLHIPTLNFAFIGRWVGHVMRGQWFHQGMANATPIQGETLLGWGMHYATGICFSALLVILYGTAWLHAPTFTPAISIGLITVIAPLLIMQPAMGAGIASSKTATPLLNCIKSIINHLIFGCGLYISAWSLAQLS